MQTMMKSRRVSPLESATLRVLGSVRRKGNNAVRWSRDQVALHRDGFLITVYRKQSPIALHPPVYIHNNQPVHSPLPLPRLPRFSLIRFEGDSVRKSSTTKFYGECLEEWRGGGRTAARLTIKLNPIQVVFPLTPPRSPSHDNSNLTRATCLPASPRSVLVTSSHPPPAPLFSLLRRANETTRTARWKGVGRTFRRFNQT